MFSFSALNGLDDLDTPTRQKLAEYLEARNRFYMQSGEVNRRRIALLYSPDADGQKDLEEYASVMLRPVQDEMNRLRDELFKAAIDLDELKDMLPMVLATVTRSVNLPLLLTLTDFDPDFIARGLEMLKQYFESGRPN